MNHFYPSRSRRRNESKAGRAVRFHARDNGSNPPPLPPPRRSRDRARKPLRAVRFRDCRRGIGRRHCETRGATALTSAAARGPIPRRHSDPGMHLRCVVPLPPSRLPPAPSRRPRRPCRMRRERTYVSTDEPTCAGGGRGREGEGQGTGSGARVRTYLRACTCVRACYPGCQEFPTCLSASR